MPPRPSRLLGWIIAFKAAKAVTLLALGIALLTTRQSDPVGRFLRLTLALHLPLSARLLDRAIALLSTLTIAREPGFALTEFAYAILRGIEGVVTCRRKPWARWFTM